MIIRCPLCKSKSLSMVSEVLVSCDECGTMFSHERVLRDMKYEDADYENADIEGNSQTEEPAKSNTEPNDISDFTIIAGELREYKGISADVVIPDGVRIINGAFKNLIALRSVRIPRSVISIEDESFQNCRSLTTIYIPDSITHIGEDAFVDCENLKNVTGSFQKIIAKFWDCSLAELIFPNHYDFEIDNMVLKKYSGDEADVVIPGGIRSIDNGIFKDNISIRTVTIPYGVTTIGNYAFFGCKKLRTIKIPDTVTNIGYSVFSDCDNLTDIKIPDHVTAIGDYAFHACENLTDIKIPDHITAIGDYAFCGCISLTTINIPDSVTEIGDNAFRYCCKLINVTGNYQKFKSAFRDTPFYKTL